MKLLFIASLLLCFLTTSCKKSEHDNLLVSDAALAASLKSYPELLAIDNHRIFLDATLTRDFNSIPGTPLYCFNYIKDKDSLVLPESIIMKRQFVIIGEKVWTANYEGTRVGYQPWIKEGYILDGPKLEPHVIVDVVCEFEFASQKFRLLRKSVEVQMQN